nr:hypothetical protein [Tanacetum cinerariifolium]
MSSLFADTHNVVAILEKSDAAEGFEQIIDFFNGSYIHYALTVNPYIYISCIKKFWNTASVKRSGDVTRLQALVDKKKIVISEVVIREILQLDDAEGVVCLPNKEIFAGLAQMGYEKPSTKLTFYKAFFSSQWKFLIHTNLQSLSAKRTSWNEFSITMASALQVSYVSSLYQIDHSKLRVKTPLFEGMLAVRQPAEEEIAEAQVQVDDVVAAAVEENVAEDGAKFPTQIQQVLNVCSALTKHVENLENDNAAQKLVIIKLKARLKRLEKANMVKSSKLRCLRKVGASRRIESSDDMEDVFNQGRMIDDMDNDEGIELVKDVDVAESEGRHATEQAEKQAKIYHIDLDHSSKVLRVIIRDPEEELPLKTPAETPKVKDKGKGILVETPKLMKKKDQIELDAEYEKKLHEEINKDYEEFNNDIDWDAAMDHVNQKSNNPQYIKRYQGMKKRPQNESEARKNMMIYLKNTAGYKMDFFKGMIKVPIVDYQIVLVDNKPRFKIIKADETHQLYISFITLLKNFDREDLENLWGIVKDGFSTSKPTNFSNEYLLLTLKTMFEEPDGQDAIWRNQKSVHGLALVKSWKLLTLCGVHIITLSTI